MDRFLPHEQRRAGRFLVAIGLGLFLGSGAAWAQPPAAGDGAAAEAFGVRGPSFAKAEKPVRPTPSEALGIDLGLVPEVRLGALDVDALLLEDEREARSARTKVVRFGIGRDVQVGAGSGQWHDVADGQRLWVAEVASTGAIGLRLHFKDLRLPAGSELAIYAPSVSDPARGIVKSGSARFDPDRYVEHYGAASPIAQRGAFWTGTIFGEKARIEYLAPAGAAAELPFAMDRLQHTYLDPVEKIAQSMAKDPAGPCHNDVACFSEWVDVSKAVSGVGVIGSNQIFCTGQLLNVSGPADFTPYWLTANHCMDSQGEAESVEFFWLYQKASCGGTAPSIASVPRSVGATLLSTSPQSDYTLLLVEGAVPASELFWAGWTSKEPPNGVDAVAIHHPSGDHKRISFGFKDGDLVECKEFFGSNVKMVRTDWTNAVTERGSSGSGIFRADTGQLYGQLFGGPSFCGVPADGLFDCYGSFATTFTKVKKLMKVGSDDKNEQNDACAKARVVKAGTLGGRVVKILDEDWYKILVKPGQTVVVDLGFADANGDIDLQLFGSCGSEPVDISEGTGDGEAVAAQNVGNRPLFVFWRVFLADDTRNNYDMAVHFE